MNIHFELFEMLSMWYVLVVFVENINDLGAFNIGADESPTYGSTKSNIMQIFPIYNSGGHSSDYFSTVTSSSSNAAASSSTTISYDLKTEPSRRFHKNFPSTGTTIKYVVPETTFRTSMDSNSSACANVALVKSTTNQSPNLSTFVESFSAVVLATPALQRFLKYQIPAAEIKRIFYKLDRQVLEKYGSTSPTDRAGEVSQAVALYDGFTLTVYFRAVGYTIGWFLVSEGIVIGPGIPQCYASLVENAVLSYHINSGEVLYQALLDAFVNFIKTIGFDIDKKIDFLARLFAFELLVNKYGM